MVKHGSKTAVLRTCGLESSVVLPMGEAFSAPKRNGSRVRFFGGFGTVHSERWT